jgi:hypothetical protein
MVQQNYDYGDYDVHVVVSSSSAQDAVCDVPAPVHAQEY